MPRRHKATDQHPQGTAQHVAGQGQGSGLQRDLVHGFENGQGKVLHHGQGHGGQQKERKAPPHHRQAHEGHVVAAGGVGWPRHHRGGQLVPVQPQQQPDRAVQNRRTHIGRAPVRPSSQQPQKSRRRGPAQVAGEAMHAEGITDARTGNPLVQYREVNWMKSTITQAGQHRYTQHGRVAVGHRSHNAGQGKHRQRQQQDGPGTPTVHGKTCTGLTGTRDDKKHGAHEAQFGVRPTELLDEHREHQRQQQVREVRAGVSQAHQGHDARVLSQRHISARNRGGRKCGHGQLE